MGAGDSLLHTGSLTERLGAQVEAFFLPKLRDLGLTKDQVALQDIAALTTSLQTVNDALANPSAFGLFRLAITTQAAVLIATAKSDYHLEVGVTPLLLESKRFILERLGQLRSHESFSSLRSVVVGIPDSEIRDRLVGQLDALDGELKALRQAATVAQEQNQQEIRKQQDEAATVLGTVTAALDDSMRERTFLKVSLASTAALIILYALFVLPELYGWQWLLGHKNKVGVQLTAVIGAAGVVWTMIDRHHRWFALGTVVLGAVLTMIQLLYVS